MHAMKQQEDGGPKGRRRRKEEDAGRGSEDKDLSVARQVALMHQQSKENQRVVSL